MPNIILQIISISNLTFHYIFITWGCPVHLQWFSDIFHY